MLSNRVTYPFAFAASWFFLSCSRDDPSFGNNSTTVAKRTSTEDSTSGALKTGSGPQPASNSQSAIGGAVADTGVLGSSSSGSQNLKPVDPGYADPTKDSAATLDQLAR